MAAIYQSGARAKSGATFCTGSAVRSEQARDHGFALSRPNGPSFAVSFALWRSKGAGKTGRRLAPASPCATEMHTVWTTGVPKRPAFPARMVLTVSFVLSPGSDALLPPSRCGWLMRAPGRAAHITARLDAQTPGVRTTRLLRPRTVPPDRPELACAHPR